VEREVAGQVFEVTYAEEVRALGDQRTRIEGFRVRAGLLLSSAAVTTSFLAGQALRGGQANVFAWLALLEFAAVAALSLAILSPSRREIAAESHRRREDRGGVHQASVDAIHRAVISHLRSMYSDNSSRLIRLAVLFQLASLLLTIEVLCWVVAIATLP
jgi:hypothetical protein